MATEWYRYGWQQKGEQVSLFGYGVVPEGHLRHSRGIVILTSLSRRFAACVPTANPRVICSINLWIEERLQTGSLLGGVGIFENSRTDDAAFD